MRGTRTHDRVGLHPHEPRAGLCSANRLNVVAIMHTGDNIVHRRSGRQHAHFIHEPFSLQAINNSGQTRRTFGMTRGCFVIQTFGVCDQVHFKRAYCAKGRNDRREFLRWRVLASVSVAPPRVPARASGKKTGGRGPRDLYLGRPP